MKKIGVLMIAILALTGCGVAQVDLTEQESQTISAYAAHVTLQYDKNYGRKLVDTTQETQENATGTVEKENELQKESADGVFDEGSKTQKEVQQNAPIQQDNTVEEITEEVQAADIVSMLQLEGFEVSYEGLVYAKRYEDIDQGSDYVAVSLENNEFLILNFRIKNTTDETKTFDMLSLSPKLQVSINGDEFISNYATLLSNDLSTFLGDIEANKSKDVVLLVEIPQEYDKNVTSVSLRTIVNNTASTVELVSK